jgi:hypothetical protein
MDDTYNEFSGTELDQDAEFDSEFDWDDEGEGDLIPILGLSAALAAVVGAILVLAGRRKKKTPMDRVEEFMGDVGKQGKKTAKKVAGAVGDMKLGDLLSQAMDKAGEAAADVDLPGFADEVKKRARKLTKDVDLGSMLEDALDQAKRAAKRLDLDDKAKGAKKAVAEAVSNIPKPDIDTRGVESFLEALKEKIGGAIDSVRSDIAPKAAERFREDVIPAAQGAAAAVAHTVREDVVPAVGGMVQKVREDVLPSVEERASKLMGSAEVDKRARRVASTAGEGAKTFAEFARGLAASVVHRVIQDVLPEVTKVGGKVMDSARRDVMPTAGRFAGKAAERVGDVASQAPGFLSNLLGAAREQAEAALEKAGPIAEDAATFGRHRLSDLATFTRHRAGDIADGLDRGGSNGMGGVASAVGHGVGSAVSSVGRGVTGAASSVGHTVTGAVSAVGHGVTGAASAVGHGARTAVGATTYATRESVGILFWLATLGGLILLIFTDKERQKEIMNGALQFFNELREMWTDLQGPDYAPENVEETDTASQ